MVQTLKAIKGGGGSIKVGTTGSISSLISRELDSTKSAQTLPSCRDKSPIPLAVSNGATTPKRLKPRTPMDKASSSGTGSSSNQKSPENCRKPRLYNNKSHEIAILNSDNVSLDGTPRRQKAEKKGSFMVEIVDVKCGNTDRKWASPITNRLKKFGFSKLSESVG